MKDEGVNVRPKLSDQERHAVGHQARDEVNVTAEAVQFGHSHRTPLAPRFSEGRRKLWPTVNVVDTRPRSAARPAPGRIGINSKNPVPSIG